MILELLSIGLGLIFGLTAPSLFRAISPLFQN